LEDCHVTPTSGLKRLGAGIVVAVAALLGMFAAVPLFLQTEAVREAVQREIRSATGFDPVLAGEVTISSFPATAANFEKVSLGSAAGNAQGERPALSAERLTAQLRFLPLLIGRIEVAEITLHRPHVLVDVDASGQSNWALLVSTLSNTLKPENRAERAMSFSEVRLVDGTIVLRDLARGETETIDEVELSVAWPAIAKSLGATGHFVWRGERVDASLALSDFLAALSGERAGLKFRVNANPLKLAFDGHIGHLPTLKVEGTLAADSESLRNALVWVGQKAMPGGGFGRFSLKAQMHAVGNTVALSGVNVELDGNAAEGVLTFVGQQRALMQGTLAAEQIDITPYISDVRLRDDSEREWNRVPFVLDGLGGLDFDLRLSTSRTLVAGAALGRTALGATLRDGRLSVTIGDSQAFGGTLKGSIGFAKAPAGAELKAQLQFTDVDLESSLNALFGVRRLEGRGSINLSLDATGQDVEALARAMNGSGTLVASRGALTGLNVEQLLRRLERRPLSGAGEFRGGRTPFEKLAVSLKVTDGTAKVESVQMEGSAIRLALGGSASIPARALDLQGVASLVAAASKDGNPAFELPFVVRGRWDDPVMLPDVQSLLRRSGAAAPLLDAVRDGRARDTIRSVIEQATRKAGSGPAADSPASAAQPSAAAQ
jgi:AsmA protein